MCIVELTLHTPILATTFEECPTLRLTVDSQNMLPDGVIQMLVWAETDDYEALESALAADSTIGSAAHLISEEDRRLYRVRFSETGVSHSVHSSLTELGVRRLEAVGTSDGWDLRLQFPDRESVTEFYDVCRRDKLNMAVRSLYEPVSTAGDLPFGLSHPQRQALLVAHERGYFGVPRTVTLAELGEELDVSGQAVSERLRRGVSRILDHADL